MTLPRSSPAVVFLGAAAAFALLSPLSAVAQNAASAALGQAAKPKIATPATVITARPGEGSDQLAQIAARDEAIASCNMRLALSLGATAQDAQRILMHNMGGSAATADSAAWVRTPDGQLQLGYWSGGVTRTPSFWSAGAFGDYVPPGGIASLPLASEAFPAPSKEEQAALQAQFNAEQARRQGALVRLITAGASAADVAKAYLDQNPALVGPTNNNTLRADPTQAYFVQQNNGLVILVIPTFGRDRPGFPIDTVFSAETLPAPPPGAIRNGGPGPALKQPAWAAELDVAPPREPGRC